MKKIKIGNNYIWAGSLATVNPSIVDVTISLCAKCKGDSIHFYTRNYRAPSASAVDYVEDLMLKGKTCAIYCMYGKGRTGTLLALLMARQGVKDPVAEVRKRYKKNSIESSIQVHAILREVKKYKKKRN